MADGSISGNSGKAVEESEEMTWFYFSPSPTYFPSLAPDFPPSPPLEFPWSPPPPSSDSRPVLPLAFDGSQPPMENPHQFTTNSLPLLPPPPQNQQEIKHQDNVSKQYVLAVIMVPDPAVSALQRLLEFWTDTSRFSRRRRIMMTNLAEFQLLLEYRADALRTSPRGRMILINSRASAALSAAELVALWAAQSVVVWAGGSAAVSAVIWAAESAAVWAAVSAAVSAAVCMAVSAAELEASPAAFSRLHEHWTGVLNSTQRMMNNSRGEQSTPIPREGLNMVVRQRHSGNRVTKIRRPRHWLCTFDNAEEVALTFDRASFKLRGENAWLNFPNLFLDQNRAAESTAPPRTEFPPTPAQQHNPEEDPGSGRSEAVNNEVEGLGWGSGTGEGERRKILEIENKKTRGVRITIPLEDIQKYSEMSLVDAAKKLNVSRSTLKRVCRDYDIKRWPPRSKIISRIPQLNSNYLQLGSSNQALSSTVVHTNQPQLSSAEKQPDTDPDTEKRLSSFKQPNDENIVTIKARYMNNLTIRFPISLQSSGLVELEQEVAKRLDLEAGTYYIKYKDEENDLILIACDEDFQDCARLKGTSLIEVFLEPKHAAN